jgi:ubiquinone/menaquinone biosynthesis C-methylase UbiE
LAREAFLEPLLGRMRFHQAIRHIPSGVKVLDVGCGKSATFLKTIAPRIQQGIGVDFKVKPLRTSKIEAIALHLDRVLPFEDASFDIVTMLAVLEHIEYEKDVLVEIHRVLKQNGKLILTVPSIWSQPVLEFLSYQLKIVDEVEIRDHKRYYNRQRLRQVLVEEARFRDFKHQYFQFWMNNFCIATK